MNKAIILAFLVISLPVCFAIELDYDANGNLVSGDGFHREYNSLNQLSRVYNESINGTLLEEFIYDPVEERVLIKKNYIDNETTYYFSKDFVQVVNSSGVFNSTYVYHNGQLIAEVSDGLKEFTHTDHLGSSTVVTDENGSIVENTSYSPFGEVLSGGNSRYGYEGKEHDDLVDDVDFHFRKYKPEWGMFTQPDSLIQNVYDPQSLNRYSFERNNPYKYVDPTGHDSNDFYKGHFDLSSNPPNLAWSGSPTEIDMKQAYQKAFWDNLHYKITDPKGIIENLCKPCSAFGLVTLDLKEGKKLKVAETENGRLYRQRNDNYLWEENNNIGSSPPKTGELKRTSKTKMKSKKRWIRSAKRKSSYTSTVKRKSWGGYYSKK